MLLIYRLIFQYWHTASCSSLPDNNHSLSAPMHTHCFFLSTYDFCSSCGLQKIGLQSVSKPASCCFCRRQENLKWHSTSLPHTVILKAALKSPSTMGKWSPSSTTYLLSVIHASKSRLWLMSLLTDSSGWCSIFLGSYLGLFIIVATHTFSEDGILF